MPRRRHATAQAARLLSVLAERPDVWCHGYDLTRRTGLASGTLYPLLMRLQEAGYLEARWEATTSSRPPRHVYRLTASGAAHARTLQVEQAAHHRPVYREAPA